MPRIFVAYRTDDEIPDGHPDKMADGSKSNLWKRLRAKDKKDRVKFPNSNWRVAFYQVKADVKTICQIIEDLSEVEAESTEDVRVNEHGQVRKTD